MSIVMPNDLSMDDVVEAMKRALKTGSRMYVHLTRATIERYGREGELTIRYSLRAYGHWRGTEMREAHHALGLEINMKNLIGCWDNASTYIAKEDMEADGVFEPYYSRHDVHYCPAAEAWKDADFHQWGHVYCDEFHQACASTYHPDGNVVIPTNLMKGDDHCHFRWVMPPDAPKLELGEPTALGNKLAQDYRAESELEAAWKSLKRTDRLMGGWFYTLAGVIIDRHGETEGREVILDALDKWGAERGSILRREHEELGIQLSATNFLRHHDFPARLVWDHHIERLSDGGIAVELKDTPHDQAWADTGSVELGGLWYHGSYPAMARSYMPGLTAAWTHLKAQGNPANRLELRMQ